MTYTDAEIQQAYTEAGTIKGAARKLGCNHKTVRRRIPEDIRDRLKIIETSPIPSEHLTAEDIIAYRKKQFAQLHKARDAQKRITLNVDERKPIGILHMGDPHVDDQGTDLETLYAHCDLIRETDGMYGACIGDITNNWVGNLKRLYAEQSTSEADGWILAADFLKRVDWLYMVRGNHDCHDTETQVYTDKGWKTQDQISPNDSVLSYDTETGQSIWSPILDIKRRDHNGDMVRIKTQSVDLLVTPNHRVLCKKRSTSSGWGDWEYIHADSLPPRVALPCSAESRDNDLYTSLSDEQIALAGWLLTDGGIETKGKCKRATFYQSKKEGSEIIEALLVALGLCHKKTTRNRDITHICGKKLKSVMPCNEWALTADATRKVLEFVPERGTLPDWCQALTSRQFGIFLDAVVGGDGTWCSKGDKRVAVIYKDHAFLSELQAIAIQHGWCARISKARESDYRLNLCKRDSLQFETKPATTIEQYNGLVWCLTVPLGNFLIRRNGAAHFSGNCWSGAGDPLDWILRGGAIVDQQHRCRLRLQFANGRDIDIYAAHNFKGNSQWNKGHGVAKTAQMGFSDHILINGHTHVSAYNKVVSKDPTLGIDGGRISHCLQIASYKTYDRYADQLGLEAHSFGPCCVTVIDPTATKEVNLVQVFDDPYRAAEYLTWLRNKA